MNPRRPYWRIVLAIFALTAIAPSLHSADPNATKTPLPTNTAQQEKSKLVHQLFKDELAAAKSPEEQVALARKLTQNARETKDDAAGSLALYTLARDLATDAGDVKLTFEIIDAIDARFAIDAFPMKADSIGKLNRTAKSHLTDWIDKTNQTIDEAVVADRYSVAHQLADMAVDNAQSAKDTPRAASASARTKEINEIETAYNSVKTSLETLDKSPTNPQANLEAGKFYCLLKNDWEHGLPMLALSKDATLAPLAQKELKTPDADAKSSLADAWYELAQKESGVYKKGMLTRAYQHYCDVASRLTGLQRAVVDKRIKELEPIVARSISPGATGAADAAREAGGSKAVHNLLPLFPKERIVNSALKLGWVNDSNLSREVVPYTFPAEYFLTIDFTYLEGPRPNTTSAMQYISVQLPLQEKHLTFRMTTLNQDVEYQFQKPSHTRNTVNQRTGTQSQETIKAPPDGHFPLFEKNRRYKLMLEIRSSKARAVLDGKELCCFEKNFGELSQSTSGKRECAVMVGACTLQIHTLALVDISAPDSNSKTNP